MSTFLSNLPWNRPSVLPWVILFFASLNEIFLGGKRRAFGSYVAQLRKDFTNVTLTELNWIGDSYSAIGFMTSGLSITMIIYFDRRYAIFQFLGTLFVLLSCVSSSYVPNPHWLFLTHTVFHGIGSSLIIAIVGLVVNEHFDIRHQYHLLATTLISGGSVASITFVAFYAYIIQKYNWRISFLILGGIYFVVNGSAAIFFRKKEKTTDPDGNKRFVCNFEGITPMQVPLLVFWFLDRVMTSIVVYGLLLNLTDYVHRSQPDLLRSTTLTTLFAAGEGSTYVIGAIITAVTKNFFKNKLGYILLVSSFIMGTSLMILEFTNDNGLARKLLCFIVGFSVGPSITFLFPAGEEMTRLPGHLAYPFSLGGMGLGMILSPLLTAKIAEMFMYKWFFLVQACLIYFKVFCLSVILLLLFYYKKYSKDKHAKELWPSSEEIEIEYESPKEDTRLLSEKEKQ